MAGGASRVGGKTGNNLNEVREPTSGPTLDAPRPQVQRAAPAASQPATGSDGVDTRPSTELPDNIPPAGQKMKADAEANSEEMWKMNAILMQIQHEQAMQKLVVEAASAIQKNAADVGEFMVNKI